MNVENNGGKETAITIKNTKGKRNFHSTGKFAANLVPSLKYLTLMSKQYSLMDEKQRKQFKQILMD